MSDWVTVNKFKSFFNHLFGRFKAVDEQSELMLKKIGLNKTDLIAKVEAPILAKVCDSVKSSFTLLGGSNNLGFLLHQCEQSKQTLISKMAYSSLLKREKDFLEWHKNAIAVDNEFAVNLVASGHLNRANEIEWITTEKLERVKKPSAQQVIDLYLKSAAGKGFFKMQELNEAGFEGGSRIRDVLINLVSNTEIQSSQRYLKNFFQQRIDLMPQFEKDLLVCLTVMQDLHSDIYANITNAELGFVHGDFKASNMLQTKEKKLRLIDFQYYCLGFREWDLAFYLSKTQKSFNQLLNEFNSVLSDKPSVQRFVFFYILANLLHPKPERFFKIFSNKINPAILSIQQFKSNTL